MENVRKVVPDQDRERVDIKGYWKVIWRKKYYLLVPLLLSAFISGFGVRYLTPVFKSSTVLSLETESTFSSSVDHYINEEQNTRDFRNRQYLSMITAKLKSNSFLKEVISDLGLMNTVNAGRLVRKLDEGGSGVSPTERVQRYFINILNGKIEISSPASGFYEIGVLDTDPGNAYVLAKKISEKYLEVQQKQKLEAIRRAGAFSDEQLAIYREKLEASEKELARVENEISSSISPSNPVDEANINMARIKEKNLDAEFGRTRIALKGIRSRLSTIFDMVPSSKEVSGDEEVINIENRLTANGDQKILAELDGQTDTESLENQTESMWESLRRRISKVVREEYSDISAEYHPVIAEYFYQRSRLDHYQSMRNTVRRYIRQYENNMARKPVLEKELERLRREVENNRAIHQAFLESKASAQISEAVQSTNLGLNLNIIETAQRPIKPVKPDKLKIVLVSVVFGIICGFGALLVTEYMDDSFKSIEEVERVMQLPVLGTIPKTVPQFAWEKKKWGKRFLFWIIGLFLFVSIISGAIYFYARTLSSSGLGVKITEETNR